jgi:hypothetical protein
MVFSRLLYLEKNLEKLPAEVFHLLGSLSSLRQEKLNLVDG